MTYDASRKQYKFYSDPGHGWLEVNILDLADVGLGPESFTQFSYRKGDTCYLEEDCDAAKFFLAFCNRYGEKPTFIERNDGAFIRNLRGIHATA